MLPQIFRDHGIIPNVSKCNPFLLLVLFSLRDGLSGASSDMLTTSPPSADRRDNNRPYSHSGQVAAVTVSLFNSNRLSVPCRAVSGRRWWTIFGGICLLAMATRLYDLRNPAWVAYVYSGARRARKWALCRDYVCVWGGGGVI